MASTSTQKATSSSYSPPQWNYDVFLSFRGKDTRNNFTGHLYSNLVQGGIDVYMDDRGLERGKTIEPALWQAIEDSRFSVVVFSRDYASSPWCLDELVKIVQCMKEMGHTALPVFYDVDPSEVANQTGNYKKAFIEHKEELSENPDKLQSWIDCLSTVANVSGWDVRNRDESQSIKRILEWIQCKLSFTLPSISKNLVGIDSHLKVLNDYMDDKENDILFIGICGMGGIGKTTVARVMYDRIRWQFESSCFLANVREVFAEKDGPSRLQEQLLSEITMELPVIRDSSRRIVLIKRRLRRKKVLLILDDVDDEEQLQMLAAEHGSFGLGSRIIITSRDARVFDSHGVSRIIEIKKLSDEDALKLFSWKAFKRDQPDEDLWDLSEQVVGYADGLPLALEVIGLFLYRRGICEWKSAIDRMKYIPDRKIIDVLRISFDGLHLLEQKIFLDIACFLKGMKKDRIIRLLDSCGYHADIGMQALMEKSLISVSRDEIRMHNLLQKMGEDIVRRESPEEPGSRSRLYVYKDVCDALKENTGKIETISLDMPRAKEAQWNMKAFSKMTKLRLLKIHNVDVYEGPEYLSNELRFLQWHAYPSKSLPACFRPDELIELYMSCSSIEQLWYGRKISVNLKIINLSNSVYLTTTPDFTGIPNLESLILEGCASLSEVHPSFGHHKKVQFVNLVNCINLRTLPSNLEMESLKACTLNGCLKLDKFPDIVGNMNCLREIRLDETGIAELPSSFHRLGGLVLLSMNGCKNLESIPIGISGLKSLKKLDVSDCSELKSIPENLGKVESLEEFDASGTSIRQPPTSFFLLKNLKLLSFNGCKRLAVNLTDQVLPSLSGLCSLEELDLRACNLGEGAVPEDIGFLSSLRSLNLSRNNFVSLPESINQLSRLEKLALKDCVMLESLLEVPLNVQKVKLDGCLRLKEIPNPIKLSSMKRSEFKCLNCWELYNHNGQNKMGLKMLEKYLQGSLPRPGFSIAVPGNDVPDWFNHQSKGSSIRVEVPRNEWMGFAACVAFSTYGKSPLFCYFKVDGKESYPSQMYIGCNSMQVVSDHLWMFYLSFDYLKDLKEQDNEAFNNLELSFDSYEQQVKVKNCGVRLVNYPSTPSWQSSTGHLIVASKEAVSSYIDSLANSLCYNQWMHDVFHTFRGVHSSNNFTHLYTTLIQSGIIRDRDKLELLRVIGSSLLGEIKESGLSVIIFARDYACSPSWAEELVKIGGFIKKMKPDTIFPISTISYNVEQSKVDERTESYTIVFDKDEEDFSEYKKVRRWMNILTEVPIPSSESSERVNGMDWPVGNKFYETDYDYLGNFTKKITDERNKRGIVLEFEVTQLLESCVRLVNSPSTPSWQSPTGHLIVASKEAAFLYIDSLANSLCYHQWMHDVFYSFRGVHSSNNFTHLYTALVERGIIRDHDKLELLRAIEWSLFWEIKESGLSIIIFARDYACSPWWFDELVKIVGFIKKMKLSTIFPVSFVSYNVQQSKVDERTESYTIVFDKDEEDFSEYKKLRRWMNILTEVPIPSSESSERVNGMDWPVGNKFYETDRDYVGNYKKKITDERNKRSIDFQFEVTQLFESCIRLVNSPSTPSWQSLTGHLIVASKEAAFLYINSLANSLSYHQWMHDVFYSFRGVHSSNNFTHLYTALVERGIIRDRNKLELLRAIEWSLFWEIKESGLSIIIFARDYACSPWWFDELVKIVGFIKKMKRYTVFPVSFVLYNVKQSKVDERSESYTIVFDKNEEDFSENKKRQRWINILTEVAIPSSKSSKRVKMDWPVRNRFHRIDLESVDWPVGNRFQRTDLESVENFLKKILSERNKRAIDFEFEVTQLFKSCIRLANFPTGILIVASKEAASSYIDSPSNSLCYHQWMHDVFCSFRGVHSSNNFTHLYTTLVERGIIRDRNKLELLRAIEWSLFWEIKESGLSIIIFGRDYACSPWWFDELVKIVGFIKKMKQYTVFPVSFVSYNVEQSKVDERTESYTIVFDKDEEDFSEKKRIQRWINILTEVAIPSSESSERVNDMDWPVGNRFHGTDLQCVQNFLKKIDGERNKCDIDFEFDVTQLVQS